MTTDSKPMAKAFAIAGKLERDGKNQHKKYTYASAEQVKRTAGEALASAGLFFSQVRVDLVHNDRLQVKGGGEQIIAVVKATITIDGMEFEGYGAAADYGPEAYLKAQTVAIRESQKNALGLSTADKDPEDDSEDKPVERTDRGQSPRANGSAPLGAKTRDEIKSLFRSIGFTDPKELSELCTKHAGVKLNELTEELGLKFVEALKQMNQDGVIG